MALPSASHIVRTTYLCLGGYLITALIHPSAWKKRFTEFAYTQHSLIRSESISPDIERWMQVV